MFRGLSQDAGDLPSMKICLRLHDLDEFLVFLRKDDKTLFEPEKIWHREFVEFEEVVMVGAMNKHQRAELI